MSTNYKKVLHILISIKKCSLYLQNADLLVCSDHKPLLQIFTGYTNNAKYNTWSLEAAAIPRHVNRQHIKGIANVLADSVSRLRAVGLYHDLQSKDYQQEFSSPFKPLSPVKQSTHMPIEVIEIFIALDIEKLTQNYDALHDLLTAQMDKAELSLENASPTNIPHLTQNLMSLLEFIPDKVIKLQKNKPFCKHILQQIHCSKNDNYFIGAVGILYKKVINFNSTFSAVVILQILIKYLLHASHDSLDLIGARKLYHFLKRLYYFQGMSKKIQ